MNVADEIVRLREWLREDETRLQSDLVEARGGPIDEKRAHAGYDFNQFGDVPWNQFNNWGNGG
jgi:hypothetical protein